MLFSLTETARVARVSSAFATLIAVMAGYATAAKADAISETAKSMTGIDMDAGEQRAVFSRRASFLDGLYRGRLMLCGDQTKSIAFPVLIRRAKDDEKLNILRLANAGVEHARSKPQDRKTDPNFCTDALRLKQANDADIAKTLR